MKNFKILLSVFSLSAILLTGCTNDNIDKSTPEKSEDISMENKDHMTHDDSGEIPKDLKEAKNPTYKVGDKVKILTNHMEGMEGAEGTVVGAFDTVAYEVSYKPTNGDPREENHKWVIQEEIKDSSNKKLEPGTEVTLEASHMKGMKDATATIESSENTTVYMVDYKPTTGGEEVKNHKWVTELELSAR